MALPRPIHLALRIRETFRRACDVDEEELHLMDEEHSAPQSPNYPPVFSHLERGGFSTLISDRLSPCQRYVQMAQGIRSSLSPTHNWVNSADISLTGEHPAAAGGFANIWEGVLNGRKVVVKSYRCYILFDHAKVISVCCRRCPGKVSC